MLEQYLNFLCLKYILLLKVDKFNNHSYFGTLWTCLFVVSFNGLCQIIPDDTSVNERVSNSIAYAKKWVVYCKL